MDLDQSDSGLLSKLAIVERKGGLESSGVECSRVRTRTLSRVSTGWGICSIELVQPAPIRREERA